MDSNFLSSLAQLAVYFLVKSAIAYCIAQFMSTEERLKFEINFLKRETACLNRVIETFQKLQ